MQGPSGRNGTLRKTGLFNSHKNAKSVLLRSIQIEIGNQMCAVAQPHYIATGNWPAG